MKLSRREVPVYGQAKVYVQIGSVEEEDPVFIVLEGSTLLHFLQTRVQSMMYFIVPGHNLSEEVCVRAYSFLRGELMCVGMSSLTYVDDEAQELAEHLVTQSHCLISTEHTHLIGRYGLNKTSTREQMDKRVTLALANLHTPQNLLGQTAQETLLHLSVRLGFVKLSEFLLCQPGTLMAIRSANQDGETPLQLAQQTNQQALIKLFKHPPNPLSTPLAGVSHVWAGRSHLFRFSHGFGALSLTVSTSLSEKTLKSSIFLLRDCVTDSTFLKKIKSLRADRVRRMERSMLLSFKGSTDALDHNEWNLNSGEDDDEEDLDSSDESDGITSLTDSTVTVTTSINTLQPDDDQEMFSHDSTESEFESDSSTSEQDSQVQAESHTCSPDDELLPSKDEDISLDSTSCGKVEEEQTSIVSSYKCDADKYKVSRTLSFLRSCMVNTKIKNRQVSPGFGIALHQLSPPNQVVNAACEVCETADSENLQQCGYCGMIMHKTCRDTALPCLKKSNRVQMKSADSSILIYSSSHSSPSLSLVFDGSNVTHRKRSNSEGCGPGFTLRKSISLIGHSSEISSSSKLARNILNKYDDEPHCPDTSFDYTIESWSAAVDSEFSQTLDKDIVKRQEIIYELMQTEYHHIQTLTVMADVLRRGLLDEVQLEHDVIGQIFPSLDELMAFHKNFLIEMENKRWASVNQGKLTNYIIQQIGDILLQQFSGPLASNMIELYADFCSRHPEALKMYKQLLQCNRKLQLFIRQQASNPVIKRREIPEFLLLVTQRITKYPVLVERLLQHTDGESSERYDIVMALEGLRGVLEEVERRVGDYERNKKLNDIISRLDSKSCTRLKNGEIFSKQDLQKAHRSLTHASTVMCRTTSGRLRDVFALLLTDMLVYLQEKEQKFVFAALEQKPSVMHLQRLIVREIANQERGLFLISSDCSVGPEMYEIHTPSREDRNIWMSLLRQAAESLPDESAKMIDGEITAKNVEKLQEELFSLDLQICSVIEEKLRICRATGRWSLATCRLLVQPHPGYIPQGVTILSGAQEEVVKLAITLLSWLFPFIWSPSNQNTVSLEEMTSTQQQDSEHSLHRRCRRSALVGTGVGAPTIAPVSPALQTYLKVAESVQSLTQILYSLQAAVIIQDSCFEVQNLQLLEGESMSPMNLSLQTKRPSLESSLMDEREREQTELLERLMKEREEIEKEMSAFEEKMKMLREEEISVNEQRERLITERKRMVKERQDRETQLRLLQHSASQGRTEDGC